MLGTSTPSDRQQHRSLSERAVVRVTSAVARRGFSRRSLLWRAAVVGSALTVSPWRWITRPQSAYASACGEDAECEDGWSAFCCTITDGANTCPPGSYVAGWWKVDDSEFCRGSSRFYVDCNRLPDATCNCTCADGDCDHRRVCCNNFRYGQCNQHIPGTTEVVCRIVLCIPPWEWDPACTSTVRTAEQTRTHTSTCLPGPMPSPIEIKYMDLGLTGSVLGRQTTDERDAAEGGRIARYGNGVILWRDDLGAHAVWGRGATRYLDLGAETSVLGYPVTDAVVVEGTSGHVFEFEGGGVWVPSAGEAWETTGLIHDRYLAEGGAGGWLGFPVTGVEEVGDGRLRSHFASGWSIAADPDTGQTRVLPSDTDLPAGGWPAQARVRRLAGQSRIDTAVAVSATVFAGGSSVAYVARDDDFADALTGGVAAALQSAPVLLARTNDLPEPTVRELERLAPDVIRVLGGPNAISDAVIDRLRQRTDADVVRIAGTTRFGTAVQVSRRQFAPSDVSTVYVATGRKFPDSLVGGPAAARAPGPVLLTELDRLPNVTRQELARLEPQAIVILGGVQVVSTQVEQDLRAYAPEVRRLSGPSRFDTAAAIVEAAFDSAREVVIATGDAFPDGLAAGPAAYVLGGPSLLTASRFLPAALDAQLRRLGPARITIVGGTAAVSAHVARRLSYYPVQTLSSAPTPSA